MKERSKNILIAVLIVGLVSMTVAYAALTQVLNINASAKVLSKSTTWNVHFANLGAVDKHGYANVPSGKGLVLSGTTTLQGLEANLSAPGDYVAYKFDIVNDGTINAKVSGITLPNMSTGVTYTGSATDSTKKTADENLVKQNIQYELGYCTATSDATYTAIAQNDTLNAGQTKSACIRISYKSTATDVPSADVSVTGIDAHIDYVQK